MSDDIHVECAVTSYAGDRDQTAPAAFRIGHDSRFVVVAESIGPRARSIGAAHRATSAFVEALPNLRGSGLDASKEIRRALEAANAAVYVEDDGAGAMGPTGAVSMAVVMVRSSDVLIAGIGDVQCYRARAGNVSRLTREHSPVAALSSPEGMLTRALGIGRSIEPDVTVRRARDRDRYVLCSAGPWAQARPDDVGEVVARARSADDACQALRTHVRSYDGGYVIAVLELALAKLPAPSR